MAKENRSKYAVLGMLATGPKSGYDIKQTIETSIGHFWNESYGQIYPILKRLTQDGLRHPRRTSQQAEPPGSPGLYHHGARVLAESARLAGDARRTVPPERIEILLRLVFGQHAPAAVHIQPVGALPGDRTARTRAVVQRRAGATSPGRTPPGRTSPTGRSRSSMAAQQRGDDPLV